MYLIITLDLDIRKSELLFKTYLVSYCLYSGSNLSTNKKSPLIVTLFSGQLWQNRCALIYMLYEMTSASIWHKEKETFLQFFMLNVCLTKLTYALNRIPLSSILIWPNYLTGLKSENSALQIELHDVLDYCNGSKVCITLYLDFMKFKLLLKTSIFSFLPTNQIR